MNRTIYYRFNGKSKIQSTGTPQAWVNIRQIKSKKLFFVIILTLKNLKRPYSLFLSMSSLFPIFMKM